MAYDEMVNAIGQGVFTGLLAVLTIVAICWCLYQVIWMIVKKVVPKIRERQKNRKIGKSENDDQSKKDR